MVILFCKPYGYNTRNVHAYWIFPLRTLSCIPFDLHIRQQTCRRRKIRVLKYNNTYNKCVNLYQPEETSLWSGITSPQNHIAPFRCQRLPRSSGGGQVTQVHP